MVKRARLDCDAFYAALHGREASLPMYLKASSRGSGISASTYRRVLPEEAPRGGQPRCVYAWSGLNVDKFGWSDQARARPSGRHFVVPTV